VRSPARRRRLLSKPSRHSLRQGTPNQARGVSGLQSFLESRAWYASMPARMNRSGAGRLSRHPRAVRTSGGNWGPDGGSRRTFDGTGRKREHMELPSGQQPANGRADCAPVGGGLCGGLFGYYLSTLSKSWGQVRRHGGVAASGPDAHRWLLKRWMKRAGRRGYTTREGGRLSVRARLLIAPRARSVHPRGDHRTGRAFLVNGRRRTSW